MLVAMVTPFSCGLACLESVLFTFGFRISQFDMLANHRDLCSNVVEHTFGALTEDNFAAMVGRYRVGVEKLPNFSSDSCNNILLKPMEEALIALCVDKDGGAHYVRLISIRSDELKIMNPRFPFPVVEYCGFDDFFRQHTVSLYRLFV